MNVFEKCERCGSVWANDSRFVYVEMQAEQGGLHHWSLCPDCADEVFWFLEHPEEQEEVE